MKRDRMTRMNLVREMIWHVGSCPTCGSDLGRAPIKKRRDHVVCLNKSCEFEMHLFLGPLEKDNPDSIIGTPGFMEVKHG